MIDLERQLCGWIRGRADALLDKGDMDGRAVWIRIIAAIKVLEAQEPDGLMH